MNIRLSGAICGETWMPQMLCGIPGQWNVTREKARIVSSNGDAILVKDAISLILNENGGDFQHAQFTGDTELIFEYRKPTPDGYVYHCRTFELADCPSLADYVRTDCMVCDFLGIDE